MASRLERDYLDQCSTVSKAALIKRIKRKLAHEFKRLRRTRGDRGYYYYVVNDLFHCIEAVHVDPEQLGRELRVLGSDEKLEADAKARP